MASKFYFGYHKNNGKEWAQMWVSDIGHADDMNISIKREITGAEFAMTILDMEIRYPRKPSGGWSDGHVEKQS